MGSITIRNLDDAAKRRLRARAAEHGRSLEKEAREILRQVVEHQLPARNLGLSIDDRFAAISGIDVQPSKSASRGPTKLFE